MWSRSSCEFKEPGCNGRGLKGSCKGGLEGGLGGVSGYVSGWISGAVEAGWVRLCLDDVCTRVRYKGVSGLC